MSDPACDGATKRPKLLLQADGSDSGEECDDAVARSNYVPPPLVFAAQRLRCTLFALRLVDGQGGAMHPFVPQTAARLPTASVIQATMRQRLSELGSGGIARVVLLLSRATFSGGKAKEYLSTCCRIATRVASKAGAAAVQHIAEQAKESLRCKQRRRAQALLHCAVRFGHVPSMSLLAWMLIYRRRDVQYDVQQGYDLATRGARLGCSECQGGHTTSLCEPSWLPASIPL